MCDKCNNKGEFIIKDIKIYREDTYIKDNVEKEEYNYSIEAERLKVGPSIIAYDKDRKRMVTKAGIVLNSFPEEVPDSVARDIAMLAVKITKAGLSHNDFHAGNIIYIDNNLRILFLI